tara:strand:- start:1221 stop:1778 length:558 start_codon:yes stop_codon:yes gene_type:complete
VVDEGQGFRRPELVDGRRGVREEYRVNVPSRKSYIYYSKYYYLIAERYYLIAERKRDKERERIFEEEEEEEEESFVLIEGEKCVHFNSKRGTSSLVRLFLFHLFFCMNCLSQEVSSSFRRRTAHDSALDELVVVNFGRHENDVVRDIHLSRRHGIVFLLPRATSSSIRVVSPRLGGKKSITSREN